MKADKLLASTPPTTIIVTKATTTVSYSGKRPTVIVYPTGEFERMNEFISLPEYFSNVKRTILSCHRRSLIISYETSQAINFCAHFVLDSFTALNFERNEKAGARRPSRNFKTLRVQKVKSSQNLIKDDTQKKLSFMNLHL